MKFLIFNIALLIAVVLQNSVSNAAEVRPTRTTTTEEPTTTTEDPTVVLRNCGETFFGQNGVIEYKLGENYTNAEKCSFVIRAENYSGFVFTLEEHGFVQDASVSIMTFEEFGLIQSAQLGPINPLNDVFLSGPVAVVVFSSSERAVGTGFRLRFQGVNPLSYSTRGNQTVFSTVAGQIGFSRNWNGPEPVGTFEVYVITQNHTSTVSYKNIVLEANKLKMDTMTSTMSCGRDGLRIYSFSSAVKYEGVVCDVHYNNRVFETTGIFIVLFRNFGDNSAKTFQLDWDVIW